MYYFLFIKTSFQSMVKTWHVHVARKRLNNRCAIRLKIRRSKLLRYKANTKYNRAACCYARVNAKNGVQCPRCELWWHWKCELDAIHDEFEWCHACVTEYLTGDPSDCLNAINQHLVAIQKNMGSIQKLIKILQDHHSY